MGGFLGGLLSIWQFDRGVAILFLLCVISFLVMTGVLVSKIVRSVRATTKQIRTWMRDSGRTTPPDTPNPELGAESPALVNLLVTRGKLSRDAVRATVLDLAARGAVELYQPGTDPAGTVILATHEIDGELTTYERRVLDELRPCPPRTVLFGLPFLQPKGMRRWHRQFRREVQEEARGKQLTFLDSSIMGKAVMACATPCGVIGFFGGLGPFVILLFVVLIPIYNGRSRAWLTVAGRSALGRWLGVRLWLQAHEVFAELPPAAVAIWGRYLAYGAALEVSAGPR
jgi:hypothetical protein